MKSLPLLLTLLLPTISFAHDDRDWSQDYQAYLSVQYELPGMRQHNKSVQTPTRLDMAFFKEKLEVFAGSTPFQGQIIKERGSAKNLDLARKFLEEEYTKLGFVVSYQPFGNGTNFIAEKAGTTNPEKVLILSSHIDSVGNKGANDNGTGTIGLLAVAKVLAKSKHSKTIRILGFDREEIGLVGSDAYVATIRNKTDIIGNINFEMMGVNSRNDGAFHVIDCNKSHSLFLSGAVKQAISNKSLPLTVVKTCTSRSDHASFWNRKIPAIVISENFFGGDADPCYHAKCDVVDERLNYNYMGNILESVLTATEELVK